MAKKTFAGKVPADLFITAEENAGPVPEEEKKPADPEAGQQANNFIKGSAPKGYYLNPQYIEAKTRRVQLLIKPSLYEKAKEKAQAQGISFNEYINLLLEDI